CVAAEVSRDSDKSPPISTLTAPPQRGDLVVTSAATISVLLHNTTSQRTNDEDFQPININRSAPSATQPESEGRRPLSEEHRSLGRPATQCEQHVPMEPSDESAVRCPVCGGPAKDVQFSVDTDTKGDGGEQITIHACNDTAWWRCLITPPRCRTS